MTVLGLICGINAAGLSFALMLRRWISTLSRGTPEARRLAAAVRRACQATLHTEYRLIGYGASVVTLLLFVLHWLWGARGHSELGIESGFWSGFAVILGAAVTCVAVEVSTRLSMRAALPAVSALRLSADQLFGVALRAGGAAALATEAIGVLSIVGVYGLVFAMGAGLTGSAISGGNVAVRAASLLPAFGIGSGLAAMVFLRGGTLYKTTAELASRLTVERLAGIHIDDPRSPSVIANLVGDHVGRIAVRAADDVVAGVLGALVALAAAAVTELRVPHLQSAGIALAVLPLVVRAFGLIASCIAIVVTRNDTAAAPSSGLWRGQISSHIIALAGLAGASLWMLGDRWTYIFGAGTVVLAASSTLGHLLRLQTRRRSRALRETVEAQKSGESSLIAAAFGHGLQAPLLTFLVLVIALGVSWILGAQAEPEAGGYLALLASLATMLAVSPYMSALGHFATIAEHATRSVRMVSPDDLPSELRHLHDAQQSAASVSQSHRHVLSAALVLVAAIVVARFSITGSTAGSTDSTDFGSLSLLLGALGGAVMLGIAGSSLKSVGRALRLVSGEIERQLRPFPVEHGRFVVPADFTPSYRSCVELTSNAAVSRVFPSIAFVLAFPATLVLSLELLYTDSPPGAGLHALAVYATVAAAVSLAATLAADSAHQLLTTANRGPLHQSSSSLPQAAMNAQAISSLACNHVGEEASLLIKVTAIVILALAPFVA